VVNQILREKHILSSCKSKTTIFICYTYSCKSLLGGRIY